MSAPTSPGRPVDDATRRTFVGVDGCKHGWVSVALDPTSFVAAGRFATFDALLLAHPHADVIAVDMPIGLVDEPSRAADQAGRAFLQGAGSSIFNAPARSTLGATTHEQAKELSLAVAGKSLSAQSFALLPKIQEVGHHADDPRVFEVHPEISVRVMKHAPLLGKKTWGGLQARLQLLADENIRLPADLGDASIVGIDDVVDAAAAAWSARRIALGSAQTFPASRNSACPPAASSRSGRRLAAVSKRKRLIGTTDDAVDRVEARLGRVLPLSLREWYLTHNGSGELSPIRDERDPRTWDDVFELREKFAGYHEDVFGTDREDLAHLVPIMDPGGDTVCPDYGGTEGVEPRVVVVSHEDASVLPIRAARSPVGAPTWREVAEMGSWRPVARPSELRR